MAKTIQRSINNSNDPAFLDPGSTIKSSGLFGAGSSFIPILTFLSGPALGKEIPVIGRQLTLGRGSDCDVMIPDPSVSRKHLQICCRRVVQKDEASRLKIVVRDMGSRNGTMINYAPVRSAVLKPGDKIMMGRVILKFEHRDIAEQSFYDEIYRLATTDSLTSLLNKAAIARALADEVSAGQRRRRRISVVLVDIDEFKSLNDLHGHLTGDRILQSISNLFRSALRRRDKVGRFGGDEFLIVLPETGRKGAHQAAERIRRGLETSVHADLGIPVPVTASFGVASGSTDSVSPEELLQNADTALYRAKSLGRNRSEAFRGKG